MLTTDKKRKGRESISLGHNLNAPISTSPTHISNSAWHIQLEHAIHNASPEDLRNIIVQLKTTTANAQMKLLSVSTKVRIMSVKFYYIFRMHNVPPPHKQISPPLTTHPHSKQTNFILLYKLITPSPKFRVTSCSEC
jgi:hypothetical protein